MIFSVKFDWRKHIRLIDNILKWLKLLCFKRVICKYIAPPIAEHVYYTVFEREWLNDNEKYVMITSIHHAVARFERQKAKTKKDFKCKFINPKKKTYENKFMFMCDGRVNFLMEKLGFAYLQDKAPPMLSIPKIERTAVFYSNGFNFFLTNLVWVRRYSKRIISIV